MSDKRTITHAGVTNDQLMVCAGCDYRIEYERLSFENKQMRRENKAAWLTTVIASSIMLAQVIAVWVME